MTDTRTLDRLARAALWLSHWTIHHANHVRPRADGEVKVGGHQASSASMAQIMTALYFHALRPEDRVAVKPHASPVFHAIQALAGNMPREKLERFRGLGGAQSYPSRTKDVDDVDFSTGSVGLGVAATLFASLVQDYLHAKDALRPDWPMGRMVALVGDAELDEGNVYEALQEGWKHDLRNCWWIVDYNRQSLDGVVHEGLWERIEAIFRAFGWRVARLRHGKLQEAAFAEPGGERLREWIEACPNQLYSALTWQGGKAWRARLTEELGDQGDVSALLDRRSDAELAALMANLGGHCMATLCDAFDEAAEDDRPTVFLAYTIKGWGTPLAGHKDNHAGLMNPAQFAEWQREMDVERGAEWDIPADLAAAAKRAPFFARGPRRLEDGAAAVPAIPAPADREISTQAAFGKILDAVAKQGGPLADRIVTMSPDVTVSTNLGPWVNRRGLFDRRERPDTFRDERVPSTQKWAFGPEGQHLELGIAEMNLFLALGAAGLSHSLFGRRLIPVGTLYDPFVARGLDALNYACYGDARFLFAGTPSGVSLAPEGGAHQSIASPLIGMSQDGLAAFEPAFADELAIVMGWAFDYLQREGRADEGDWARDAEGGSVYLRLSTRPLEQPGPRGQDFERGVIDGAYWLRPPSPRTGVVIAYQGAIADQAIAAAGRLGDWTGDVAVLAVTSADRLNAGWTASEESHVARLLADVPGHAALVTVIDGHPATLAWLGGVHGHRVRSLGVEHFGQTGTVADLHRHFGIDADGIVRAAKRTMGTRRARSA
ncbi:transketolase-like TK C-terminal-containing protein [Jannaschia sp. W003]|uniref:transketolase-like TK C-terminal-containing protein n=1 Tax=Jannaschia sp. W003 TaxID=2867012 RepID=UPI0021A91873|nr:transketolase [Jannaschia sp. W003]UWQ22065.1 transketolase [Jannaschia sp. W003]